MRTTGRKDSACTLSARCAAVKILLISYRGQTVSRLQHRISCTLTYLHVFSIIVVSYFANDSEVYKTILTLDCRGIEPTSFDPRSGWVVRSENKGLVFKGVDLSADPTYWCEYDTKNRVSVTISEFASQFIKVKK